MVDTLITLYECDEREFKTNGLGSLNECVSCSVLEERNGEFELSMEYPVTGRHFSDLIQDRIIFAKPDPYRDPQPFRIYDISKPFNGIISISARHISYDLSGYPIAPFTADTLSLVMEELNTQMKRAFNANKPPFHFSHRKNEVTTQLNLVAPCNARALLGGSEGTILDTYRGEYEWDRWNVILHNKRGNDNGIHITYGKNLTDFQQEENCDNVWTGVYPYWYYEDEETGSTLVELSSDDSQKIIYCDGTYNHERILILDLSTEFQEEPTPEQLRERALQYIEDNQIGSPTVNLTVSFLNLSDTVNYAHIKILEKVSLCDTVVVEFPEMGVNSSSTVISTTYDVLMNKYSEIQLGEPKSNLATTISNQTSSIRRTVEDQRGVLQRAIENATKLITGGLGGYVILHSSDSNSKYPDEILIMDTPDINTAQHVWRWNSGGLGYSKTGYNGDFELAMTMDGSIVATFITSGELNGALIKAGTITAECLSVEYRDAVTKEIETAILASEKAMRKELVDLGLAAGDIDKELHSVVEDNIITEAEKRSIQKMLQQLEKEKKEADTAYTDLYAALEDDDPSKTTLLVKKDALNTAYTNLVSAINTVLAQTTAEGIATAVASYNEAYDQYKTAHDEYEQALQFGYDSNYSVKLNVSRDGIMASVTEIQNTLVDAISDSKKSLQDELVDLGLASKDMLGNLQAIVEDNIITEAEKKSIEKMLQQLEKEKKEVDTAYDDLRSLLSEGGQKDYLDDTKTTFDEAYTSVTDIIKEILNFQTGNNITVLQGMVARYKNQYELYTRMYDDFCQALQRTREFVVDEKLRSASNKVQKELIDLGLASEGLDGGLNAIVEDNIITEAEKRSIEKMLQQLEKEKLETDTAYNELYAALPDGIVKDDLSEKQLDFDTAYGGVYGAIERVLDATNASDIKTYMGYYKILYDEYKEAYDAFRQALQLGRDEIVDNKIVAAEKKLQKELIDLGLASGDVDEGLHSVVEDNIITEVEKRSIQKVLQQLEKEKREADTAYTNFYKLLADNPQAQSELKSKKDSFDSAYSALISAAQQVVLSTNVDEISTNMYAYDKAYTDYSEAYDAYQQALNVAVQVDYTAKLEITREGIMSDVEATYATADSVTKLSTTVTQVASGLTSTVTVNENDENFFGSILEQQYDHFLIGFNGKSTAMYFYTDGICFYSNEEEEHSSAVHPGYIPSGSCRTFELTRSGAFYYRNGLAIGKIGAQQESGKPDHRGLSFDLDPNGTFMSWNVWESDHYEVRFYYARAGTLYASEDGLYLGCKLHANGYSVNSLPLYQSLANGYSTVDNGVIPVVTNIEVNENGELTWETANLRVRNGMITSVPKEMVVSDK